MRDQLTKVPDGSDLSTDLLTITVTPLEARAVIDLFGEYTKIPPRAVPIGENIYHYFGDMNGTKVTMVQSSMGAVSPGASLQTVQEAIEPALCVNISETPAPL
jgi:hypothetical protein